MLGGSRRGRWANGRPKGARGVASKPFIRLPPFVCQFSATEGAGPSPFRSLGLWGQTGTGRLYLRVLLWLVMAAEWGQTNEGVGWIVIQNPVFSRNSLSHETDGKQKPY